VALKLDPAGRYQWHTFWGKPRYVSGTDVALDEEGHALIATSSDGSWLGEGERPPVRSFAGDRDAGILKLLPTGEYAWHTFEGGPGYDGEPQLAVDERGGAYLTWGYLQRTEELHPNADSYGVAISAFNPDGQIWWSGLYGGPETEWPTGLAARGERLIVAATSRKPWLGPDGQPPLHAFQGYSSMAVVAFKLRPEAAGPSEATERRGVTP
jgi:hypothetical protein